jgi:hypothetical protein
LIEALISQLRDHCEPPVGKTFHTIL